MRKGLDTIVTVLMVLALSMTSISALEKDVVNVIKDVSAEQSGILNPIEHIKIIQGYDLRLSIENRTMFNTRDAHINVKNFVQAMDEAVLISKLSQDIRIPIAHQATPPMFLKKAYADVFAYQHVVATRAEVEESPEVLGEEKTKDIDSNEKRLLNTSQYTSSFAMVSALLLTCIGYVIIRLNKESKENE